MKINPHRIAGVYLIDLQPIHDDRGYFLRAYDRTSFESFGLHRDWVQENESRSTLAGTLRGLHFQKPPFTETKLIRVVQGKLLDVFVDCRPKSPTFGQHGSVMLHAAVPKFVFLPPGIAHGFCTLSDDVVLSYKVDKPYTPTADGGIRWNDASLGIVWPVEFPTISQKDQTLPTLAQIGGLFDAIEP